MTLLSLFSPQSKFLCFIRRWISLFQFLPGPFNACINADRLRKLVARIVSTDFQFVSPQIIVIGAD